MNDLKESNIKRAIKVLREGDIKRTREGDIKRTVEDYLQFGMNQGKWYFDRLNSGSLIICNPDGSFRRKVRLCREGTADFIVIRKWWPPGAPNKWETLVIFLELKSAKGKLGKEQRCFKTLVEAQGALNVVIKSIEDLKEVLE